MYFYTGFPLIVAGVAVIMDLRTARVDNGWILFSIVIGVVGRFLTEGCAGLIRFGAGAAMPVLLLGWLFAFRMLGAGDIKLFCALGGIMGVGNIGKCILFSLFVGACISIAILISNGSICQRFHYFMGYLTRFLETGERKPYIQNGMSSPENFHFTVPVFLSVVLYAGGVY